MGETRQNSAPATAHDTTSIDLTVSRSSGSVQIVWRGRRPVRQVIVTDEGRVPRMYYRVGAASRYHQQVSCYLISAFDSENRA